MPEHAKNDRVYMREIERKIKRSRSTIRTWERNGWMPPELLFHRDESGWRYWTRDQLKLAKKWMKSRNPGRSKPRASA